MRFGIALDLGPAGGPLGQRLDQLEPVLRRAEAIGLESVWVGENYATPGNTVTAFHGPSALTVAGVLARQTSLEVGTGVVLLGAYDMLRLAYDIALVDSLSGGRLTVGIGLGTPMTATRFGQPEPRTALIDERLAALHALLAGEDGYEGSEVAIVGGIHPLGHGGRVPPILIGGGVRSSLRRAARFGNGWYASSAYSAGRIRHLATQFGEVCAEMGQTEPRIAINRLTVLKSDTGAARAIGTRHAGEIVAAYGAVGALDDNGSQIPPGQVDVESALAQRSIIGDAAAAAGLIEEYADMGVTDIQFRIAPIGLPVEDVLETLDVLGEGILSPRPEVAVPTATSKSEVEDHG